MKRAAFAALALLLVPAAARAGEDQNITVELRPAWTIIGTKNATGGFTLQGTGIYNFAPSAVVNLGLGVDFGAFGFGGASRWVGILGGPVGRITVSPIESLALSLTASLGIGRVPVCTPWAEPLCPRFVGIFPALMAAGMWVSESGLAVGPSLAVRIVDTAIGTSVGCEPALNVGFYIRRK